MAGPAAGRVPAIPLRKAPPRHSDRDHRDAPLRGGPAMTKEHVSRTVTYGNLGNRNRQNINKLLIDDRRGHLWRARHPWRRHLRVTLVARMRASREIRDGLCVGPGLSPD